MKLDTDEEKILSLKPDGKILFPWFFTKTIPAVLFISLMTFFLLIFTNTFEIESKPNEQDAKLVDDYISKKITEQESKEGRLKLRFKPVIDHWKNVLTLSLLAIFLFQLYLYFLRRTYKYIITNKRCIFIGGILKRIERVVPYNKITDIQRTQNILERMFGIWNVQIFTPGTASMSPGQRTSRAELNYDGLLNSEQLIETINKYVQKCN